MGCAQSVSSAGLKLGAAEQLEVRSRGWDDLWGPEQAVWGVLFGTGAILWGWGRERQETAAWGENASSVQGSQLEKSPGGN